MSITDPKVLVPCTDPLFSVCPPQHCFHFVERNAQLIRGSLLKKYNFLKYPYFSTYSFYFPILAPDIRPPPPTLLTGMLEPPPPPPGVEPDQDDIGIKFKSFDLNKVEHEPPRTLAGYEAEVNV